MASAEAEKQTMMAEVDPKTQKNPDYNSKFVILCAVLASTNSVVLGYDGGVMSGVVTFMKKEIHMSDVKVEILMGSANILSLLGAAMAGRTSDAIGRRWTMALAAMIFVTGALLMAVAPNFALVMVGRMVEGIGVGYALLIAPVYTAEVAPATSRGTFTSFPEIFINVGILIGYVSNYALAGLPDRINWRLMLGLGAVPPLFLAFAVLFMPESPRWLLMRGRHDAAMVVLRRTSETEAEAQQRMQDIVEGIEYAKQKTGAAAGADGEGSWREIFRPTPAVSRMLIVALGVQFFQQAGGVDSAVLYSPTIFKSAGIQSTKAQLGATIAVGFCKASFVVVAAFLIDRVGRRVLLLTSTLGSTVALLLLATSLEIISHSAGGELHRAAAFMAVLMVCLNMAFFSIGMGPVNWVLGAEIFPLRLRAKAASLGVATNRGISGIVAMTFLSITHAITVPGIFFIFAGVSLAAAAFVYFLVPETKGKTLEEIVALFHNNADSVHAGAGAGANPQVALELGIKDDARALPSQK